MGILEDFANGVQSGIVDPLTSLFTGQGASQRYLSGLQQVADQQQTAARPQTAMPMPSPQPQQQPQQVAQASPNPHMTSELSPYETFSALFGGMGGKGLAATQRERAMQSYDYGNQRDALIGMGISPKNAEAMIINPALMQQLLPQYAGAKTPHYEKITDSNGQEHLTVVPATGGQALDITPNFGNSSGAENMQTLVDAIGQYKMNPAALSSGRNAAQVRNIMAEVYRQYKDYDVNQFGAIRKAEAGFSASGQQGQAIASLATSINHLSSVAEIIPYLHNSSTMGGYLNRPENAYANMTDPNYRQAASIFNVFRTVGVSEVARALRGTGAMSDAASAEWEKQFDVNSTPEQMYGAIQSAIGALKGRIDPQLYAYNQTTGQNKKVEDFLDPQVRARAQAISAIDPTHPPQVPYGPVPESIRMHAFGGGQQQAPQLGTTSSADALTQARAAIQAGRDPNAVKQRLQQLGIDPGQL